MLKKQTIMLLILDGWGFSEKTEYNAIAKANTPQWDRWLQHEPHLFLKASGEYVGLPKNQMGNSEVGHMHIGAGRIIRQDLSRINQAIKTKEFFQNPVFIENIEKLKKNDQKLHVIGLFSKGGVHSHENHLFAFLELCKEHNLSNIKLHLILDGRDTPPRSAAKSLKKLIAWLKQNKVATICSITGRFYAMDRDNRWERTQKVYDLLSQNLSDYSFSDPLEALKFYYKKNITDEFIPPTLIDKHGIIQNNDSIFFFNFRSDRARQLTKLLLTLNLTGFISMTRYSTDLKTKVAFPPIDISNNLGEILAKKNLTQLRIAETEKYAHVTFFFNGGFEKPYPLEDRVLIPSPSVKTYDLTPRMSTPQITEHLIDVLHQGKYDVIICNFANPDMLGHTGNLDATIKAIEYLDEVFYKLNKTIHDIQGKLIITADHGNAEVLYDLKTSQPHTAHTTQPVPFIFIGGGYKLAKKTGSLIDLAPTILYLLGLPKPNVMIGQSLLQKIC